MTPAVERLLQGYESSRPAPLPPRQRIVEVGIAAAFLAVAVPLAVLTSGRPLRPIEACALVAAFAVASRIKFAVGPGYTDATQLILVPMLFVLPTASVPLLVALSIVLAVVVESRSGRIRPGRTVMALGDSWFSLAPAVVLIAMGAGEPDLGDWPIYLAALAAQFAVDLVIGTVRDWLSIGVAPKMQPQLFGWIFLVDALIAPVGLLAALASTETHAAIFLILPLIALLAIFAGERKVRIKHALELSSAYRGTTLLLGEVLSADDEYTGVHSRSVVSLALAVADEMGLDSRERRNVEFGALLHDVGKIAIPKEMINKPGPLTEDEWVIVKTHTIEGQRMLDRVGGVLRDVGQIVRSSHEHWDGTGYPDGLAGEEIPLAASIVGCCDAFNAITTDRPYRPARSVEEAALELRRNAGTQFNPAVVNVIDRLIARGGPLDEPLAAAAVADDVADSSEPQSSSAGITTRNWGATT